MRKIFLILCAFLVFALGVNAIDNEFKNMLININVDKIGDNAYRIDLVTQVPYVDEVKVVKKSDYNYYILLAETYSQPTVKKIGDISPLEVQLYPYVEQGLSNGYTKITLNTTRPLDFTVSLKAKEASKFPIMDIVKLAKLDQMYAQNQTTVKGGKVLVASAPSSSVPASATTSVSTSAAPAKTTTPSAGPKVASKPAAPATTVKSATPVAQTPKQPVATKTPSVPVVKPTVAKQAPIEKPEPVRLPINVKPLPQPVQPQSTPSYEQQTPIKIVTQKPAAAIPTTAPAPKAAVETPKIAPAQKVVTPKAAVETPKIAPVQKAPIPKAAESVKIAKVPQKQIAPARPAPAEKPLYEPRKQAPYVPMKPPEEYKPVEQQVVEKPVAQEPVPVSEPQEVIPEQEPQPIAAVPQSQEEFTFTGRLALAFENAKTNNPVLFTVLLLALGLFIVAAVQFARVNANNKKAVLAQKQKIAAERAAQREQKTQQRAQRVQARQMQRAQQESPAQEPPIQYVPASAPMVEPVIEEPTAESAVGWVEEKTVMSDVDVEEIMAQVTPQDLAPEILSQTQRVEVVELPNEENSQVVNARESEPDGFEIFEINFEESVSVSEAFEIQEVSEPEAPKSAEEITTQEIMAQLAPQFDEFPDIDDEPALQPVTISFEDEEEIIKPMSEMSSLYKETVPEPQVEKPAEEEIAPIEPAQAQESNEVWHKKDEQRPQPQHAVSEPASLSRPSRRPLRHRRPTDTADILSKVRVEKDRGFYLADYKGVKALVGYIMDDLFVINTFKDKELRSPQINFRLSESTHDGDYYLVKVDNSTMLVKSQKDEMSLQSIIK